MNMFSINRKPLMTKYLVDVAQIFVAEPVVIFDIGARGGFNEEWGVFKDQVRLYCFEADEEEHKRLLADAPPNVTYICSAVGGTSGPAKIYETHHPAGSGLYAARMEYFGRLLNRDNQIVEAEHAIDVRTIDDIMKDYGCPAVDFIKLDVEGAEVDILKGSPGILDSKSLLGIQSEIRFHREINGSAPFYELEALVNEYGFRLYDLQFYHQSRRALPYPGLYDYRMPSGERFFAYTTHGQIQDGDAVYFRDLMIEPNRAVARDISISSLLKLCAFLEIYSLNDCAAELIIHYETQLRTKVDCTRMLDLLASETAGRDISYEKYLRDYFAASTNKSPPFIGYPPMTRTQVLRAATSRVLSRLWR